MVPSGGPAYRDAVLLLQEEDAAIGTHLMPYRDAVDGTVGLNYPSAPLEDRLLRDPDPAAAFSSAAHGDPPTPVIEAHAGDPLRLRVVSAVGEQGQVFSVEGHRWRIEPRPGSMLVSSIQLGPLGALTLDLEGGAGGPARLVGDYLYGDHREPYREAGLWGLLRVRDPCADAEGLRPLPTAEAMCGGGMVGVLVAVASLGAVGVLTGAWHLRRSDRILRGRRGTASSQ